MKKKIIAILAVVLLLSVSSAAYAMPSVNSLEGVSAANGTFKLSNDLVGLLKNRLQGQRAATCGGVSNGTGCKTSDCLKDALCIGTNGANRTAGDCLQNTACNGVSGSNCKTADSLNNALKGLAVPAASDCLKKDAGNLSAVLDAVKKNAGNSAVANAVILGANCNRADTSAALKALVEKLLAGRNCPTKPVPTATTAPVETPVVTNTPAATEKPVQTPAVTKTPAATEKPAETPVITETPAATAKPTAAPTATVKPTLPSNADNLAYEEKVVQLVNEQREANGLKPLTLSSKLSDVARLKSQDMHDNKYFSHTSPTYGSPFDMMKSFGISYRTAGENIAMGYSTPEAVVNGWMNSPGHRANILNAAYTTIGVGYVASGHYWTQHFIG